MSNPLVQQALTKMGYNGRFQKILLAYLAVAWFGIAYILLGCSFIFMNPLFRCSFSDDLVTEDEACDRLD